MSIYDRSETLLRRCVWAKREGAEDMTRRKGFGHLWRGRQQRQNPDK